MLTLRQQAFLEGTGSSTPQPGDLSRTGPGKLTRARSVSDHVSATESADHRASAQETRHQPA